MSTPVEHAAATQRIRELEAQVAWLAAENKRLDAEAYRAREALYARTRSWR